MAKISFTADDLILHQTSGDQSAAMRPDNVCETITIVREDGRTYTLDLGPESLAEHIAPLCAAAPIRTKVYTPEELDEIRRWARSKGYSVNDRGRIPADIVAAFEQREQIADIVAVQVGKDKKAA